jgi:hypothetical protein
MMHYFKVGIPDHIWDLTISDKGITREQMERLFVDAVAEDFFPFVGYDSGITVTRIEESPNPKVK